MVLEKVRVFIQIDCFEGEFAEAFAPVGVGCGGGGDAAAAEFGAGAVLVVHCGGWVRLSVVRSGWLAARAGRWESVCSECGSEALC